MIIYKITNLINRKAYVGQTIKPLEFRWASHNRKFSKCEALKAALIKYGKENFKIETIAKAKSIDELNELEEVFIRDLNTLSPNGYNLHSGGRNRIPSQETRKKLTLAQTGNKKNLGKKQSEETKRKIGAAQIGQKNHRFGKIGPGAKEIICSNGLMFPSIKHAAKKYGLRASKISLVVNGIRNKTGGMKFYASTNSLKGVN